MATSCLQLENRVNNKTIFSERLKCESICIAKLMKYGIFILHSDSELPESISACLPVDVLHTEFTYSTFKTFVSSHHKVVEISSLWSHVLALSPLSNFPETLPMYCYIKQMCIHHLIWYLAHGKHSKLLACWKKLIIESRKWEGETLFLPILLLSLVVISKAEEAEENLASSFQEQWDKLVRPEQSLGSPQTQAHWWLALFLTWWKDRRWQKHKSCMSSSEISEICGWGSRSVQ